MKIISSIKFEFNSPNDAEIFYKSFIPEFQDMPMKRSKWTISNPKADSNDIIFQINSEDATAFRATINSLIQFANIVEKTLNLIKI